jgi:hypothetical protein
MNVPNHKYIYRVCHIWRVRTVSYEGHTCERVSAEALRASSLTGCYPTTTVMPVPAVYIAAAVVGGAVAAIAFKEVSKTLLFAGY